MFGFKKKETCPPRINAWEVYPQLRWNRIASKWDPTTGEYTYLTEPVLEIKRTKHDEWSTLSNHTEVRKPA